jgi:hypothetical protein
MTEQLMHYPSVVAGGQRPHHNGPLYYGRCRCGWESEPQLDEATAATEAQNHAWPYGKIPPETVKEYDRIAAKIAAILND